MPGSSTGIMADSSTGEWHPSFIGGVFWFDATRPETLIVDPLVPNGVETWRTLSKFPMDHTQTVGGSRPTTGTHTINGLNAVRFDGVNDRLVCNWGFSGLSQPLVMAAVVRADSTAAGTARIYGRGTGTTLNLGRTAATWHYAAGTGRTAGVVDNNPHCVVGIYNGTSSRLRVDGVQIHDATSATIGGNGMGTGVINSMGARDDGTALWNGLIGEMVMYSSTNEPFSTVTSLETYMMDKWGI